MGLGVVVKGDGAGPTERPFKALYKILKELQFLKESYKVFTESVPNLQASCSGLADGRKEHACTRLNPGISESWRLTVAVACIFRIMSLQSSHQASCGDQIPVP